MIALFKNLEAYNIETLIKIGTRGEEIYTIGQYVVKSICVESTNG